jgi:ceramide glucosyltransferase
MNAPAIIAGVYLFQLGVKASLALLKRGHDSDPRMAALDRLTVVQPVTSGDAALESVLLSGLGELWESPLIWIVDKKDAAACELCQMLKARHSGRDIQIIETDEPPQGFNPKTWKLLAALPSVRTELLAVIDDDTRVPRRSAFCLVNALDGGADIATGLPCYAPTPGIWSVLLSEFVNSSAILTYLSAAECADARTINGMCYAMRTRQVRETGLFAACGHSITDDLAVAKAIRKNGGRIEQTTWPQHISTTVLSPTHYRRLMHRWFVFTRILIQNETPFVQAVLVVCYGLHPLLLASLAIAAVAEPAQGLWPLAAVLAVRGVTLAALNRKFAGSWLHSPTASIVAELLQPVFLVGALLYPVIWWRRRKIRVRNFDEFVYLT